ncbi:hypothetical protein KY312_03700 [Candidatus Woesearchaeota archaeon]|nr:hypothetical protein [Candidatus Woesearchaeota archaeon]
MECKQQSNLKSCKCTYSGCPRKGKCCECIRYHRDSGGLPACFFSKDAEATYDRSVRKFVEENQ